MGVALVGFYRYANDKATLLRVWELAGTSGQVTMTLPRGMNVTTVQPVDLRGRPTGQPMSMDGDAFTFDLRAFAPASFRLQE